MEINNLKKNYGKKEVLDISHISFDMKGIIGILGINGAGKTTFFKTMSDLTTCNQKSAYKNDISYFPDVEKFHNTSIEKFSDILKYTYDDFNSDIYFEILEQLDIPKKQRIYSLSRGQKNILNIIMTISRNTKYYFIDELFSNLDFETRETILKIIIEYADVKNKLIFISSHEIDDVERLLDFAVILNNKEFLTVEFVDKIIEDEKTLYNWFEKVLLGRETNE